MPEPKTARQTVHEERNSPPHGAQSPLTLQVRPPLPLWSVPSPTSGSCPSPCGSRWKPGPSPTRCPGSSAAGRQGARRRRRGGAGAGWGRGRCRHRVCRALGQRRKHRWSGAAEQVSRPGCGAGGGPIARRSKGARWSCTRRRGPAFRTPLAAAGRASGGSGEAAPAAGEEGVDRCGGGWPELASGRSAEKRLQASGLQRGRVLPAAGAPAGGAWCDLRLKAGDSGAAHVGLKGVRTRTVFLPPGWTGAQSCRPATRGPGPAWQWQRGRRRVFSRREEQDLRMGLEPLVLLSAMFSCFLTRHLQL